jgi:hypothetical protein
MKTFSLIRVEIDQQHDYGYLSWPIEDRRKLWSEFTIIF